MQKAEQILQAMRKMGEKRIPSTRVYRSLFSEDLFLAAYDKIARNRGALTAGTENDTVDGMNLDRIQKIIEQLRNEQFQFPSCPSNSNPKEKRRDTPARYSRTSRTSWCKRCCEWCWKPTTNPGFGTVRTAFVPDADATRH